MKFFDKNNLKTLEKKDLENGISVECTGLITDIANCTTKTGSSYVKLTVIDQEDEIVANKWGCDSNSLGFEVGDVVALILDTKEFNGNITFTIKGISNSGLNKSDFIKTSDFNAMDMYNVLLNALKKVNSGGMYSVSGIAIEILEDNKPALLNHGAAKNVHHNYKSGLLEHTSFILANAKNVYNIYGNNGKFLDEELLMSGVILHDIGKLRELDTDELGISEYTVDGQLFGHLLIGVEMVDEVVWKNGKEHYDLERVNLLKHMIASHHGNLEWGAISFPRIPEALVLHMLDNLDAKLKVFQEEFKNVDSGKISDNKAFMLNNVNVYKASNK